MCLMPFKLMDPITPYQSTGNLTFQCVRTLLSMQITRLNKPYFGYNSIPEPEPETRAETWIEKLNGLL